MTKKEALQLVKSPEMRLIIDCIFEDDEEVPDSYLNYLNKDYTPLEVPSKEYSKLVKATKEELLANCSAEQLQIFLEKAINNEEFEWAEQLKNRIDEL